MKFVSLRTERTHRRREVAEGSRDNHKSLTMPVGAPHQIHTYAELRQQIHEDLRLQHPEWVQPDGKSPICDSYEARLLKLLDALTGSGSNTLTGSL